jgi:hypothetical protein
MFSEQGRTDLRASGSSLLPVFAERFKSDNGVIGAG